MKVIKFGAAWCPACIIMKPRWERLEVVAPWLDSEYYDFDEAPEAVKRYQIDHRLPTFIFLDARYQEFLRLHGEIAEDKLLEIIITNKDK